MTPDLQLAFESTSTLTQPQFAAWVADRPGDDENHYELLDGRVVMTPPAGYPHNLIEGRLAGILEPFIRTGKLGVYLGSSQGVDLPSGDTVEPDHSFVSSERWAAMPPPVRGKFLKVVPDLIVEILSPSTEWKDRGKKRAIYERNGVREYWLVDSDASTLTVFARAGERFDDGRAFPAGATYRSDVLAGFELDVATVLP